MIRRIRTFPARLAAVAVVVAAFIVPAAAETPPPVIGAKSAVLIDADSGTVLFGQQMHDRRPMASTTKIMTALLALESSRLTDVVTAPPSVQNADGSKLALKPGEQMTLDDLLTALLLKSANDAAVAIAEHVGGSVPAFVAKMNQRAKELGANDTHFANPNGLPDPNHYSSAYDLALITREAMKHPRFKQLVATKEADIARPTLGTIEHLRNHNKLLWRDDRVDGVKTGWIRLSGECLVASETRGDWQLISVVLDCPKTYDDSLALLDYGFDNFRQQLFARRGDAVGSARVAYGAKRRVPAVCQYTLSAVLGPNLPSNGRVEVTVDNVQAPVHLGQRLGEARLLLDGKVAATSPLLAGAEIPKSKLVVALAYTLRALGGLVGLIAVALLVRTNAKVVKAYRRRRSGLAAEGGGPDSSEPRPR